MVRMAVLVVLACVVGCSSSSSGTGGSGGAGAGGGGSSSGSDVICVTTSPNGAEGCTILENLSPAGVTDATKNCQGTVENACPSGMVGCCSLAASGPGSVPQEICYYSGTASSLQSNCSTALHGTWSATP